MLNVARLTDLAEDRATEVKLGDETVILVRDGATVRAYAGKCPHAGAPLAKGAICRGRIICPWHKAQFSVADGALLEPPALERLARYPAELRDGAVFVGSGKLPAADPAPVAEGRRVVVLGKGAAGAAAVAGLREGGFAGAITLVGEERAPPYDRTALSKFVMEGSKQPDEVPPLLPDGFYEQHRVEFVTAEITGLDVAAKRVTLDDGRMFDYDVGLLATGAKPKPVDIPGADLAGVNTLRSQADAAAIVGALQRGSKVVILGSSFIGLEVASGLRKRGLDVAVVTPEPLPFGKQFGPEIGAMFRALHEANGVRFHAQTEAARIEGEGRAARVVLKNGVVLEANAVVVGVGVSPATGFVTGLERQRDGGIAVDAGMRAADGLYAAGDVAQFPLSGAKVRIEHWRVAQQHAFVAARNMAGGEARYEGVPFFWTYHYGKRFEYLGHAENWEETVIEGRLEAQDFVALLTRAGQVVGVVACQRERATAILIDQMRGTLTADAALAVVRAAHGSV